MPVVELLREFPLILLAGGKGSRVGMPKGLVPMSDGRLWIEHQIDSYRVAGGIDVITVLGHGADEYRRKLLGLATIVSPEPELGPFRSLQEGARHRRATAAPAVFVLPIDVPAPGPAVWSAMVERWSLERGGKCSAVLPALEGRSGHPVLLGAEFLSFLRGLDPRSPESRLDVQLRGLPPGRIARVEADDPRILQNLNTPSDWAGRRA